MKVRRAVDMPLEFGSFFAREGAWNRKYQVQRVINIDNNTAEVEIVNIGSHFSDGRYNFARRRNVRKMKLRKIGGTWASAWGGYLAFETSFRNRFVQVEVRGPRLP